MDPRRNWVSQTASHVRTSANQGASHVSTSANQGASHVSILANQGASHVSTSANQGASHVSTTANQDVIEWPPFFPLRNQRIGIKAKTGGFWANPSKWVTEYAQR